MDNQIHPAEITTDNDETPVRTDFCNQVSEVIGDIVAIEVLEAFPKELGRSLHGICQRLEDCLDRAIPKEGWKDHIQVPNPSIEEVLAKVQRLRRLAEQFDDVELGISQDVSQEIKRNLERVEEVLASYLA